MIKSIIILQTRNHCMLRSELKQLTLFALPPAKQGVVNVASVPQRSPFRYPGGKTWLVPTIRRWLKSLEWKPEYFLEPFAGGAIVGLTVAFEKLAEKVILVELDDQVSAVWKTILSEDGEWLARAILTFDLTMANVREELAKPATSIRKKAFQTILKNRTYHGGILAPGSGLIKHGENGKGIHSRWYPATLAKRIRAISSIRDKIIFVEGDGLTVLQKYASTKKKAVFIDPPYTAGGKKAGQRLYTHFQVDHNLLFTIASKMAGDVLLTYDTAKEVLELAKSHNFQNALVPMKNTHHTQMSELLIGKKLQWLSL